MNEQPVPEHDDPEAVRDQVRDICESKRKKKSRNPEFVPKDDKHSGHMDTQLFPNRKPPYHL